MAFGSDRSNISVQIFFGGAPAVVEKFDSVTTSFSFSRLDATILFRSYD